MTDDSADTGTELRKRYAGSRILLVEDNEISCEVVRGLLGGVGLRVETAENGKVAIEKLRSSEYELVLMDVQMPVMDGLEATRQIRAIEGKAELPILAMTADTSEGDREASAAAGMDDFIAKPIDPDHVFEKLLRWLPKRSDNKQSISVPSSTAVNEKTADDVDDRLVSIEGLDVKTGLRNMRGDVDAYLRLLHQFDRTHRNDMEKLKQKFENGDHEDARRIAHTIKGTAATLGLKPLHESAKQLEGRIREKQAAGNDDISELVKAVSEKQLSLHETLPAIEEQAPTDENVITDPLAVFQVIEQLARLLREGDTSANEFYLENELMLRDAYGELAEKIGEQIELFDYIKALDIIESGDFR